VSDTKIEHYDSPIPLGPWPLISSKWATHNDLVRHHLSPVQRRYLTLPRDEDGYPIIPSGAAAEIVEYAREHPFPLPGQNRVADPAGRLRDRPPLG